MSKIIRLTESDLMRFVKRVISEQFDGEKGQAQFKNKGKKKYEYLDEHPSYDDLNSKIAELKKMIGTISKDIMGDEGKEYIQEYVNKKLHNK